MTATAFAFLALRLLAAILLIKALSYPLDPLSLLSLGRSVSLSLSLCVILLFSRPLACAVSGLPWSETDRRAVAACQGYGFLILGGYCLILTLPVLPSMLVFLNSIPDSRAARHAYLIDGARIFLMLALIFVMGLGLVFGKALLRLRGLRTGGAH